MVWSTAGAGATLTWEPHGGDELVYVERGSVTYDGTTCPAGSTVLVDAGAAPVLGVADDAVLLHFSEQDPEPVADDARRRVAVIGPKGTYANVEDKRDTHFYAQSDDDFSATFFFTGRGELYRSAPHSHSADEILCVITGGINFGKRHLPAVTAIAVPGDRKYGFVSDDGGFGMVNYRRHVSYFSGSDGREPFREGVDVAGIEPVGDRLV
jgi:hypothetical protein